MSRSFFLGIAFATIAIPACFVGSRSDLKPELDASIDVIDVVVMGKKDVQVVDAGPTYKPKGVHCQRDADAAVPDPFLPDAAATGEGGVYGETWLMPQATTSGGPVIARPLFVPITFADEEMGMADEIEDFVASIGCTPYWKAVMSDYGVGAGSSDVPVRLPDKGWVKIDDSGIAKWLRTKLDAKDPAFPPPTADSIYAIFLPPSSTVTLQGAYSCQDFGAYHNSTRLGSGQKVAYAVMPRCGGLNELTYSASHELIEAASDPYPSPAPAYAQTDSAHLAFSLFAGGEVADLCEFNPDALFQPQNFPWTVTRSWSNSEAFFGRDPCVPADPPYFVAIPDQPDIIHLFGMGDAMRGIRMAPMDVRTIDVKLYGYGMNGTWTIKPQDANQMRGGAPHLAFSINPASGKDGDVLKLTITKLSSSSGLGVEVFAIRSISNGKETLYWAATGTN